MHSRTWLAVSIVAVVLAALVLTASADDDKIIVPKKIQDAVNMMADDIGKGDDVDKDAAAFFKGHEDDLKQTMWIFKPRMKNGDGGFGVGPKPGIYTPDGIEGFLYTHGNPRHPAMKVGELKNAAKDLLRLADVTLAVGEIARKYVPEKARGSNTARRWNESVVEMRRSALALKDGVKSEKPNDVKTELFRLYASCVNCHAVFRDGDTIVVPRKTRETVNKMADEIAKGNRVDKEADTFFNDNKGDLKRTMWVFKPRQDEWIGGLGVGKQGEYKPDGIEALILNQSGPKPKMTLDLTTSAEDLNRLANITLAMSEITARYVPQRAIGDKNPKVWKLANEDMKQAAWMLKKAVKAENSTNAKQAFRSLAASCANCHEVFREADQATRIVPQPIRDALNAMADTVGKGGEIGKDTDAFFKDHQGEFKTTKGIFKPRAENGKGGGFGIGPIPGAYQPDEITSYIVGHSGPQAQPLTEAELKTTAADLNRLADVMIVMAEVTQRYKPKAIIIGGPTIVKPADWTAAASDMKQAAIDLKAAVKANKPNDVNKAFTKLDASCVKCHSLFR